MTLLQDFCSRRLRCHCQEIERRRAREQVPPTTTSSFGSPAEAVFFGPSELFPSFLLLENCLLKFNLENSWAALSCPPEDHQQPDHVPHHVPSGIWLQQREEGPRYNSHFSGFKRDVTTSYRYSYLLIQCGPLIRSTVLSKKID